MQSDAHDINSSLLPPSTIYSQRQPPNEMCPTSCTQQLQAQQEDGERDVHQSKKRRAVLRGQELNGSEQRGQTLHSRPAEIAELSFSQLPRHSAVLQQQLLRLREEVALLQLMQAEVEKERNRINLESRDFRSIAAEQDQILQLFVQHHSSLLHPSKHAPDCIGFKGAFETQRLQPQLQGAAARADAQELDVYEHFDGSTESENDDDSSDT